MTLRVGVPERLDGPYAPVPPNIQMAVAAIGAELVVLRAGVRDEAAFDALLLTGGPTPSSAVFGAAVSPAVADQPEPTDVERDEREFVLLDRSLTIGRHVLGVCRGMQLLTIWAGGTLIPVRNVEAHAGLATGVRTTARHPVELAPAARLAGVTGATRLEDCSSHHRVGVALPVLALAHAVGWAPNDKSIEAIESSSGGAAGVLWHPEDDLSVPTQESVFRFLSEDVRS